MDDRSRRVERRLEIPVLIAALIVIPVIAIEESSFGKPWDTLGAALNWATWTVFLAEALVMLYVVPDRRRWLREHPLEVAVVVLTPPFLTALAGVRLLRLLRLLRLVRAAHLARRLFSPQGLQNAALLAVLTAVAGGGAFAALEGDRSTADGIYWAITTMTTVGYGDVLPTTTATKTLAVVIMFVGIGFVAVLTGAIAERFLATELADEDPELPAAQPASAVLTELRALNERLERLEGAIGRHGRKPS